MAVISKHIELFPINDLDITPSDNIKQTLLGKSCLNLSFQSLTTVKRLKSLLSLRNSRLTSVNFTSIQSTLHDYNALLEEFLITVLQLPSISDMNRTKLTEHYKKYKIGVNNNKILPSNNYCENLMFTNFRNWGGIYGTLGYYINLLEQYEEYLTPSQLIFKCTEGLLNFIDAIQLQKLLFNEDDVNAQVIINLNTRLRNLMSQDSQTADLAIYNMFKDYLIDLKLSETFINLQFLESYIPQLIKWYFQRYDLRGIPEPPNTPSDEKTLAAYNTLIQLSKACIFYGVDDSNINKIGVGFVYQFLSSRYNNLFSEFIRIRNSTLYVQTDEPPQNTEQELLETLLNNINSTTNPERLNTDSAIILQNVAPPGGFNLWILTLAANLLNRAYILTHRNNIIDTSDIESNRVYKRAIALQVRAGILLLKSSLKELQVFGLNLISVTNIEIEDINPTNLLDI